MKTRINFLAFIAILCLLSRSTFAQTWQRTLNPGNPSNFGTSNNFPINIFTNGTQKAIILTNGNFGLGTTSPVSLFHIDGSSNTGEVFRTTSSTNVVSAWRMLKGNGANAEKFAIYVPANSNDVILQALQGGGKMFFKTSTTATTRMTIIDGNLGYVGIGPCSA